MAVKKRRGMNIKILDRSKQPRERLIKYGVNTLSEIDLIALLLGSGYREHDVFALAKTIIKTISLDKLSSVSFEELNNISGIGRAKASQIMACFELGKRLLVNKKTSLILSPRQVWEQMADICEHKKEYFVAFFLDIRNQIVKREIVSIGSLNASIVHPREVFEPAIRNSTSQIIVSHNHPSDDVSPSEEDISITKRLIEAGKIIGIAVIDHVIVGKSRYLSMKAKGMM